MGTQSKKRHFICENCGYVSVKWFGRCPECGSWNSLYKPSLSTRERNLAKPLCELDFPDEYRIKTGIRDLDTVFGGGILAGSVILFAGGPGVGKSTLSLKVLSEVSKSKKTVLYISGEENLYQLKTRAKRVVKDDKEILVLSTNSVLDVIEEAKRIKPKLMVVDSIQSMYDDTIESFAGSISQIKSCCAKLVELSKRENIAIIIVGHITKEGAIAGPKLIEHMVDVVLYFDTSSDYRVLRSIKNRFGQVGEIAIFEMKTDGLHPISDPSSLFLKGRVLGLPGSIVYPMCEGERTIFVEVQALINQTYGMPRKRGFGIDYNRLELLVAVLENSLDLKLHTNELFVNVVGGMNITSPHADLAVASAIISSSLKKPIKEDISAFGEIGLCGEVRKVTKAWQRVRDGLKIGFKKFLVPLANMSELLEFSRDVIVPIRNVKELKDVIS